MAATFDLWQQAYVLARESGALGFSFGEPAVLAKKLADDLNNFYRQNQNYIGRWRTVWGPVVWENSPGFLSPPDNVMYVTANQDQSVYLVGIAGTNAGSSYDLNTEDNDVNHVVAWKDAFPSLGQYGIPSALGSINPYLAQGTVDGVNSLLGMQDLSTGQTLVQFLQGVANTKALLIVAGHSLGGALSPTLTLALINPAGGPLSIGKWRGVAVYPTAGPTPGNWDFHTFFSSQLPPMAGPGQPYQVWNQNVWNKLDVVPHGWQVSMLNQVVTLYPSPWQNDPTQAPQKLLDEVQNDINLSQQGGAAGLGAYMMLANQPIQGVFNTDIPVTDYNSFQKQMLYQHLTAYDNLLNVTQVPSSKAVRETYISTAKRMIGDETPVAREQVAPEKP